MLIINIGGDNIYTESDILNSYEDIRSIVISNKWIRNCSNGCGSCGQTLEKLLGNKPNNFQIPDYNGIEIKTKLSNKFDKIILFSAIPNIGKNPIEYLLSNYGLLIKNECNHKKIHINLSTIRFAKYGNYYFKLSVNNNEKKIDLLIYNENWIIIDKSIGWTFENIFNKFERKMKYLCFIKAISKKINHINYYKFIDSSLFKLKNFNELIYQITTGNIMILINIGMYKSGNNYGKPYYHGMSFNISKHKLNNIYYLIK